MLFTELRFFVFFAAVFAIVWMLRKNNWRKIVLTGASYVFYGAWDWRFLGLILLITAVCYVSGLKVGQDNPNKRERQLWVSLSVIFSLAVLGLFKYFNFFADSFADLAHVVGLPVNNVTLGLVLPVGISFYTFQAISYVLDISRGHIKADRSALDVMFYIAFFPQLVAGPIVRASDFIPQMESARKWVDVPVRYCLALFLIGFLKKACISDNVAQYVDIVFSDASSYDAQTVIAGVFLYGVQIYCDFSGYSDMAIATAGLLGYNFPKNFDAPYLSPNIQIFWRRWHISLSSWLRDYLYIPLGGNRKGNGRRYVNLMTTMVLGGLWHGASFNFVIWGALHGFAQITEGFWSKKIAPLIPSMKIIGALAGTAVTFYWVNLAWIFFRAPDISTSLDMAQTYLTFSSAGSKTLDFPVWPFLGCLAIAHWLGHRYDALGAFARLGPNRFAITLGAVSAVALAFVQLNAAPFIYFQF